MERKELGGAHMRLLRRKSREAVRWVGTVSEVAIAEKEARIQWLRRKHEQILNLLSSASEVSFVSRFKDGFADRLLALDAKIIAELGVFFKPDPS